MKRKWHEKKMHGQFVREMPESGDKENSWRWLGQGDLKVSTKESLRAAQERAIRNEVRQVRSR